MPTDNYVDDLAGVSKLKEDLEHAIDSIEQSRIRFSKIDCVKAHAARIFQYLLGHLSNETVAYSDMTDSTKNNDMM